MAVFHRFFVMVEPSAGARPAAFATDSPPQPAPTRVWSSSAGGMLATPCRAARPIVCTAAVLLVPWLASAGQQLAASRVMLATVLDRDNRPTVDVLPDDFVVEEGNDEREILHVQVADYPVTLLLDNGADAADSFAAIRQAAGRFIRRIGQRPIAVGTLADPPTLVASFDDERAAVLAAIERITAVARTPLRPLGLLTQAATRIAQFGSPFSVVVVISAGAVDPSEQPESDRIAPIVDSGAAVHVIALRPAGLAADGDAPDLLRALSEQTRGQFIPIFNPVSYGVALDRLADQLSTELMIDYLVPPGSSGAAARIGIRVPGATVRGLGVSR